MNGYFVLALLAISIAVIIVNIIASKKDSEMSSTKENLIQLIDDHAGFTASHFLLKFSCNQIFPLIPLGLAIDDISKQICLINGESLKFFKYDDIIESEVLTEGETITKTSRASQFTGAAVGGLVFGGVGAVIGGLSGKQVTSQEYKNVYLKLLINDTSNPVHIIDFIERIKNNTGSFDTTPPKVALKDAQGWHDLISVIIRQAEKETTSKIEADASQLSPADQISKIFELHNSGAITDDEFSDAKKKLLQMV